MPEIDKLYLLQGASVDEEDVCVDILSVDEEGDSTDKTLVDVSGMIRWMIYFKDLFVIDQELLLIFVIEWTGWAS